MLTRPWPELCPTCYSRFTDIHNMIFPVGSYEGHPCVDTWHKGPAYDPDVLVLTQEDKKFLKSQKVSAS